MPPHAPSDAPAPTAPEVGTDPDSLLHHWRRTAREHRDTVAATDPSAEAYTYAELDRLSDLIALELATLGDPARPLAAMLGHDARAVIALMAVLKTGRVRVVLDTHLPAQRLAQIAALSTATTAIVDDRFADLAASLPTLDRRLSFDALLAAARASDLGADELAARVEVELRDGAVRAGDDPFEIVFTSGSTGVPKGVVQLHAGMLNEARGHAVTRALAAGESTTVVLPLSFLAGSGHLTTTLLAGATAVMIDPRDQGVGPLVEALRAGGIRLLVCTPHLARGVFGALAEGEILPGVRAVNTLGEAVHGHDVRTFLAHLGPNARFINEVGASEINAIATFTICQGDPIADGAVPAGTPFLAKTVRIVDADLRDVPPGEAGEVLVVSRFLSAGYWNNPELQAEKFGVDGDGVPFCRLGDLGRFDSDGVLRLLGRGDAGVKVRGYLVEPSEIEGALLAMDDIDEAVVIPQVSTASPPAPTRLAAYVVPAKRGRTPSSAAIRRALRQVVPEYMVPSEIVQLPALPRNERGKIDRPALPPVPEHVTDVLKMDQRQRAMSTIWQQVLELPELALDDDFMALGGDSLSAEELLTLVSQHFGVDVPSTELLKHPTLREFTRRVMQGDGQGRARAQDRGNPDMATFNAGAPGTPLFAVAGAGALALTYLPLARRLPGAPLHAFQQHALERRTVPDRSVAATAARHIRAIDEVHPSGPVRLAGHSFGGIVALEIARQLTEAGREVESVTILDTYLPRSVPGAGSAAARPEQPGPARRRSPLEALLPDGLPPVKEFPRQVRAHLAGHLMHRGQRQYDALYDHAVLLLRRHTVTPFAGRSMIVIADGNPDPFSAWDAILTGERSDVRIEADHTSILREPFVAQLADALRLM